MNKRLKIPVILFSFFLAVALIGPFIYSVSPYEYHLDQAFESPSLHHWLGTDENGRDILSRILLGARISLGIGMSVLTFCLSIGITIGFFAGFWGGWFEKIFLMVSDIFQAFPGILLAIAVAAFLPQSFLNIILLLSFVGWVSYARVTRAQVLSLKKREYIEATQCLGLPLHLVFFKHVLPNIMGPLLVQAAFGMAGIILIESTLSFLGLGLPVHLPSWGRMLDSGSSLLLVEPTLSIYPGIAIMLTVMIFNFLGDRLRDVYAGRL